MVSLRLDQSTYTYQELQAGIYVYYQIDQPLTGSGFALSFAPTGQKVDPSQPTTPFNGRSGPGAEMLLASDPAVPWNTNPPRNNNYNWDIILVDGRFNELARVSMSIQGAAASVRLSLPQTQYTYSDLAAGVTLNYQISGTLTASSYGLAYPPRGQAVDRSQPTTPFAPRSSSGGVIINQTDPGVPWATNPPRNNNYNWDIVLVDNSFNELARVSMSIQATAASVRLSLPQTQYTYSDLAAGVTLNYQISGTLTASSYGLAYPPRGQAVDRSQPTTPFAPRSSSGGVIINQTDPGVPWATNPPRNNNYNWDIVLVDNAFNELARTSLSITQTQVRVALQLPQTVYTYPELEQGVALAYYIEGTLSGNLQLTYIAQDENYDPTQPTTPFEGTSGKGVQIILPTDPGVPWASNPPRNNKYNWDIVLIDANTTNKLAWVSMEIAASVSVDISLAQSLYTAAELQAGVALAYNIQGTLPQGSYGLVYVAPGSPVVSPIPNTAFTPVTGQGSVTLSQSDSAVPWSTTPPRDNAYVWDIVLINLDTCQEWGRATINYLPATALLRTDYDGTTLKAVWEGLPSPSVVGYALRIQNGAGSTVASTTTSRPYAEVAVSIAPTDSYTASVQVLGNNGTQGAWGASLGIISAIPSIGKTYYDGQKIIVTWEAQTAYPEFVLSLHDGAAEVARVMAAGTGGALDTPLAPDETYSARLRYASAQGTGPTSPDFPVISQIPALTMVQYTGNTLNINWGTVQDTRVTGYYVVIFNNGSPQTTVAVMGKDTGVYNQTVTYTRADRLSVVIQAFGSQFNAMGAYSAHGQIITAVPTIEAAEYDGANLSLRWSMPNAEMLNGYGIGVKVNGNIQSTTQTQSQSITLPLTLTPGDTTEVHVSPLDGISTGAYTPTFLLSPATPTLTSVSNQGDGLLVAWTAPDGLTPDSYEVGWFDGNLLLRSASASSLSAFLPGEVDASQNNQVKVRAIVGVFKGAWSAAIPVTTTEVTLTAIQYDGTNVSITWADTPHTVGALNFYLSQDGQPLSSPHTVSIPTEGNTTHFAASLNTTSRYTLAAQAVGVQNNSGVIGAPVPLVTLPPTITAADFNNNLLTLSWDMPDGAQVLSYGVVVAISNHTQPTVFTNARILSLPLTLASTDTATVTVYAQTGLAQGQASSAQSISPATPTLTSVSNQGDGLLVAWTAPAGLTPDSYEVGWFDGNTLLTSASASSLSAFLPGEVDASQNNQLKVRAIVGVFKGAWSAALPITTFVPSVSSITYDGAGHVTVSWSNTFPSMTTPTITLAAYKNGQQVAESSVSAQNASSGTLPVTLNAASRYEIRVRASDGTATQGPWSDPYPVLSDKPSLTAVEFDGSVAVVRWAMQPDERITGYVVLLQAASAPIIIDNSGNGDGFSGNNNNPPAPFIPYTVTGQEAVISVNQPNVESISVQVAALSNGSQSPLTDVLTTPVSTSIASASYDGAAITASWGAITGATAYRLSLYADSILLTSQTFTGTTGLLFAALDPAATYSLRVQTLAGVGSAPLSQSFTVLSAKSDLLSVGYDGSKTSLTWAQSSDSRATGYTVRLNSGATHTDTAISGISTLSTDLTGALTSGTAYSVAVRITGSGTSGVFSAAIPVLAETLSVTRVDFEGQALRLAWMYPAVLPDVQFRYSVTTAEGTISGVTSQTDIVLAVSSVPTSVSLQPVRGISSGAAVQPTVLTQTVSMTSALYDGRFITAAWAAASGLEGVRYEVAVFEHNNDTPLTHLTTDQTSATLALALSPSQAYVVKVRLITSTQTAPYSDGLSVLSAVPDLSLLSLVTKYNLINVLYTAPEASDSDAIQGYRIQLYNHNTPVGDPQPMSYGTSNGTPGWLALFDDVAIGTLERYSVRLQAVGADATTQAGAWSASAEVLQAAPVFTRCDYTDVDSNNFKVDFAWTFPTEQQVTGFTYFGMGQNNVRTDDATTSEYSASLTLSKAGGVDTVTLYALNAWGSGTPNGVGIISSSVTPTSIGYQKGLLGVSWNAVSGISDPVYEVYVVAGSTEIGVYTSSDTHISIPLSLSSNVTYSVKMRVRSGVVTGPYSALVSFIPFLPSLPAVTTQDDGSLVVTFPSIDPTRVTGYQAFLRQYGGATQIATAAQVDGVWTATFTAPEQPAVGYTVTASLEQGIFSGPVNDPIAVITGVPTIIDCRYDGSQITTSWTPVTDPGAQQYKVTLWDTTTTPAISVGHALYTENTQIHFDASLQLNHSYQVAVQAVGAQTIGRSAKADPLADSQGFFFPTGVDYPFLYSGDIRSTSVPSSGLTLYIPAIIASLSAPITAGPFTLSANDTNSLKLEIAASWTDNSDTVSLWSVASNTLRTPLLNAYTSFMTLVEAAQPAPGTMALLQKTLASALPLNFAETLYYHYGYNTNNGYVNLQPGMRLRADFEDYQLFTGNDQRYNGYAGGGSVVYDIGALSYLRTSNSTSTNFLSSIFNSFLGRMPAVTTVAPNTGGAGGVLDLQGNTYQRPYYRLFYPPNLLSSDVAATPSLTTNPVILGADSLATLQSATTQYITSGNFSGISGIVYTTFRGRVAFSPEIRCFINDSPVYVTLGTTVRQLISSFTQVPFHGNTTLRNFSYTRQTGYLSTSADVSSYQFDAAYPVYFNRKPLNQTTYTGGNIVQDSFDLPVVAGDSLRFTLS